MKCAVQGGAHSLPPSGLAPVVQRLLRYCHAPRTQPSRIPDDSVLREFLNVESGLVLMTSSAEAVKPPGQARWREVQGREVRWPGV